jgi:hypothetical protein
MYLFHSQRDTVNRSNRLTVLISEAVVAALGYATYTLRSLLPKKHRIGLRPGAGDSATWAVEFEFEIKPDQTQCVAIWNRKQPG